MLTSLTIWIHHINSSFKKATLWKCRLPNPNGNSNFKARQTNFLKLIYVKISSNWRNCNSLSSLHMNSRKIVDTTFQSYSVWQLKVQILVLIVLQNFRFTFLWDGLADFKMANARWKLRVSAMLNNFFLSLGSRMPE